MTPNITGQVLELHRAGKIRILAVNSAERLQAAPDIPTATEEGLPGMIGQLFLACSYPVPRTAADRRARIDAADRQAMADPAFQKILNDSGVEPVARFNTEEGPPSPRDCALGSGGEGFGLPDVNARDPLAARS